jgi:hypothetical protein
VQQRHEQGGADNRPHDRKRLAADVKHERLGQVELTRHPRPKESADEAEGDGCEEPAPSTRDRPADGSADGGDDDENDESCQCDSHSETSSLILWVPVPMPGLEVHPNARPELMVADIVDEQCCDCRQA